MKTKENISGRIQNLHGFINCVGMIDGTLFPFAFSPTLKAEDYFYKERRLSYCRASYLWWRGQDNLDLNGMNRQCTW